MFYEPPPPAFPLTFLIAVIIFNYIPRNLRARTREDSCIHDQQNKGATGGHRDVALFDYAALRSRFKTLTSPTTATTSIEQTSIGCRRG